MAEALEAPFDRPDAGFNDLPGWTWIGTYGGHYLQADRLADLNKWVLEIALEPESAKLAGL